MWKIPLVDLKLGDEEVDAVNEVLTSGWLTMGEKTAEFEERFAAFVGTKHAIAVSSCTAALHLSMHALGIGNGDEVICPSLTFVAGANATVLTGASPVFADIQDEDNLGLDVGSVEDKITSRTKAIQVLHYGGFGMDAKPFLDLADKHGLMLIEDCAHAVGAYQEDQHCGSAGIVGCFSFFSNKNMTTGEGGMITTNDVNLAERIRILRSHGMTSGTVERHLGKTFSYDVVEPGFNYRIDEIRSAIGISQLNNLERNNQKRRKLRKMYLNRLKPVKSIHLPYLNYKFTSANHIFPILLSNGIDRKSFMEGMRFRGIQTSIHYPPTHKFKFFRSLTEKVSESLPVTEDIGNRQVTLPLYPGMQISDVEEVCRAVTALTS
jgi:dTDP-4-amino-4,6-dideoxygalactose transaminase